MRGLYNNFYGKELILWESFYENYLTNRGDLCTLFDTFINGVCIMVYAI